MPHLRNFTRLSGWILAIVGVWSFGASVASAQRIPIRGPNLSSQNILVTGTNSRGTFVVVGQLGNTNLSNLFGNTTGASGGTTTTFVSGNVVPVQFAGFANPTALLPGNPRPPPLNNGSLQANVGNIASLPLGDRLTMNGVPPDPDFIFSALGQQNGQNGQNGGQQGQFNQQIQFGQPGQVFAARAARFRAMMADQAAAQANWNYINAVRLSTLDLTSQPRTPAYVYGPAFTTTNSLTNTFGSAGLGETGTTFNGFAKDTDSSETTLKSDGSSAAKP